MSLWRIILHWTAGIGTPNAIELADYHRLILPDGSVVSAVDIAKNAVPLKAGYAAHTAEANGNSIGVSFCGMNLAQPRDYGKYPLTLEQWDAGVKLCASLCLQFGITPDREHVLGHCEAEEFLPWHPKQAGKWDPWVPFIVWRPRIGDLTAPHDIGDAFRAAVLSEIQAATLSRKGTGS